MENYRHQESAIKRRLDTKNKNAGSASNEKPRLLPKGRQFINILLLNSSIIACLMYWTLAFGGLNQIVDQREMILLVSWRCRCSFLGNFYCCQTSWSPYSETSFKQHTSFSCKCLGQNQLMRYFSLPLEFGVPQLKIKCTQISGNTRRSIWS